MWPAAAHAAMRAGRTLTTGDLPPALRDVGVETTALPPDQLLEHLGRRGVRRAWIDGARTAQAFLAAGLVDTLTVTRLPVLIGDGTPLFGSLPHDVRLGHLDTRSFASGVVQSRYAPLR